MCIINMANINCNSWAADWGQSVRVVAESGEKAVLVDNLEKIII